MSATIGFLATDGEADVVLDWFANHSDLTGSAKRAGRIWFSFGETRVSSENGIDVKRSPLVYVVTPLQLRGVLWSAGEVGFTATPLRPQFPRLFAVQRQFVTWLRHFEIVFSARKPSAGEWNYYLEGGLRNRDVDLYALPNAARALRAGQYFVRDGASDQELDKLCAALRLRGVACEAGRRTRR